jgi:hypothetical protein
VLRIYYIYKTFYTTYDVAWQAEGAWIWTAVEAMLAVCIASLPALKVFFKKVLGSSSLGSGLRYTFRRTGYSRNGYTETGGTDVLGTQVSATFAAHGSDNSMAKSSKDVEMGTIAVTKEVDINSEESPPVSYYERNSHDKAKKFGRAHVRRMSSSETPWLDGHRPQESHANGPIDRGYSSHNGWR